MRQVMVVEPDELAVTALNKIFKNDEEVRLTFAENLATAIELLNGNPKDQEFYEKCKTVSDEARAAFQEAAAKELSAKTIHDNADEILKKYQNELETLTKPEPSEKQQPLSKAEPPSTAAETSLESESQKLVLEKQIEKLQKELITYKEALQVASRIKSENEKIMLTKQNITEETKTKIPAPSEQSYPVIMIANKLLLPNVKNWLEDFKKLVTLEINKEIKIIVLGFEFDEANIKKYLVPGISDYMIKPIDELLALQNIKFLALSDKKTKREVYSLQIKEPVDLVFEYELTALSEYSFAISSNEIFQINEFKAFNSDIFLRKGQRSVLGKCLNSAKQPDGKVISEFWFVGMDTHLAFQIKTVIKSAAKL